MNKICFIMVGVPGSGKSSIVRRLKEFYGSENDVRVFSSDESYVAFAHEKHDGQAWAESLSEADVYNYSFTYMKQNEKEFAEFQNERWREALASEMILVIDRTNLTRKGRARYLQEARSKGFTIVGVEVHVPLRVALDRQKTRGDKFVPENVIRDMWFSQQGLLLGSEVDEIMFVDGTSQDQSMVLPKFTAQ